MCRWDREQAPTVDNLVLLNFEEAEAHEGSDMEDIQQRDPQLVQKVMAARRRIHTDLCICA